MAYIRASTEITGGRIENVTFTSPTLVDMSSVRINNTGDPILAADAANKRFVEDYTTNRVKMLETNLQGNATAVAIDDRLYGAYYVSVMGRDEGKPIGIFLLAKPSRSIPATVSTISSFTGGDGSELYVTWPADSGINLGKLGTGDNGIYLVKIV